MTSTDIRNSFLKFFRDRGHAIVPSASVIPYDDPTLLFTNAGMNQFKDVFLGTGKRDYRRAADSQTCIRVSGKHNDLEEVGRDTYHHTFFEMLGNWSFGDYYKKEAVEWAWDLLTREWGLEKRRLYATVFETDEEAEGVWKTVTDIDSSHVLRFGRKDNFWEMGETGPCGPCSEIHIDLTPDCSGAGLVNAGDPRVMEIWNLVFIQYNRDAAGTLTPLPAKHVDTGMGFERICAVLQGKRSNYDTDLFMPVIEGIAAATGARYGGGDARPDVAMRVIADHVRMLSFSIADGGIPSNEGRGYVMRRILRRASRFGRDLGMREPFIYKAVAPVVRVMGDQYPAVRERRDQIEKVIRGEEESFSAALDRGLQMFEVAVAEIGHSRTLPGEDAFRLYDTFGFPLDLTELMASERGLRVDSARFFELMEIQRERSRSAGSAARSGPSGPGGAFGDISVEEGVPDSSRKAGERRGDAPGAAAGETEGNASQLEAALGGDEAPTDFVGYELLETESLVRHLVKGTDIILDKTPFYVESGGQVDDTGILESGAFRAQVVRSARSRGRLIHRIKVISGSPDQLKGRSITARVDAERRRNIERNHTATHLFHEALRRVLGTHAHQQGSLVAPDRLRFDFNHFEKPDAGRIRAIEDIVNGKISENIRVEALNDPKKWLTIEEARRRYPNVKMFFGEKYGSTVRVVEIDPAFSVELCGGTHVRFTGEIGPFKIVSESSVASGIRRIEAVTGDGLREYVAERIARAAQLDDQLGRLIEEAESLEREMGRGSGSSRAGRTRPAPFALPSGPLTREAVDMVESTLRERELAAERAGKEAQDARKELSRLRVKDASSTIDDILKKGVPVNGFTVVSARIEAGSMDELKSIGDTLRAKLKSGIGVLGAVIEDKVALVCVVTDDLIKEKKLQAGAVVGELARRVGGGGGGRPHLATAGGKDTSKLDETLGSAVSVVQAMLAKKS